MLKLGCTLLYLENICLHKSTEAEFYPPTERGRDLLENILGEVVGRPSLGFTHQAVVAETFTRKTRKIADLLLGLMPDNYIATQSVNPCSPVMMRARMSIQKPIHSHLDKTGPLALKLRLCLILNEKDLMVKLRASTLQADRRKLNVPVLTDSVFIAILCLKLCVAFRTFVLIKSSVRLSLKKILNVALRTKELEELRRGYSQE